MALLTTIEFDIIHKHDRAILKWIEKESTKQEGVLGAGIRFWGTSVSDRKGILMINSAQTTIEQERRFVAKFSAWLRDLENKLVLEYGE